MIIPSGSMNSKILLGLIICIASLPAVAGAAGFVPLVGIPGVDANEPGLGTYINAIYRLSISIAALLAVIKIVAAGAKYMLSDIVTSKEEAKKDIQGALVGLLIVLAAVVILTTVNSDLTKTDLLVDAVSVPDPVTEPVITEINSVGAFCAVAERASKSCVLDAGGVFCNYDNRSSVDFSLAEEGRTCEDLCDDISGFYYVAGLADHPYCVHTSEDVETYTNTHLQSITDANCPAGETSCNFESCDMYSDSTLTFCSTSCGGIGGEYVEGPTQDTCVIPADLYGDLNVVPRVQYTLRQTPEDIAASRLPESIEIRWTNSINGLVGVTFTDGLNDDENIPCDSIVPSVCI